MNRTTNCSIPPFLPSSIYSYCMLSPALEFQEEGGEELRKRLGVGGGGQFHFIKKMLCF